MTDIITASILATFLLALVIDVACGRRLARWWRRRNAARPEPLPRPHGVEVTPRLIQWLGRQPIDARERERIVADILARDAYGRRKYGQPLMSEDGRDHANDARQEILDCLQYLMAASIQGQDTAELVPLLRLALHRAEDDGR